MNMRKKLSSISNNIGKSFPKKGNDTDEELLLKEIKRALENLKNSELYFQNATDPQLIDYSIYRMEAALEKYTYLIRLAKERGVKCKWEVIK